MVSICSGLQTESIGEPCQLGNRGIGRLLLLLLKGLEIKDKRPLTETIERESRTEGEKSIRGATVAPLCIYMFPFVFVCSGREQRSQCRME